jgi:hypothetical protein
MERGPGIFHTGGSMGPKEVMDDMNKREVFCPYWNSNPELLPSSP